MKKLLFFISTYLIPIKLLAQPQDVQGILEGLARVINAAIPVFVGIALLVFFVGLIKFISKAGDEKGREDGKRILVWGLVVLSIMVAIWGIIAILQGFIGIGSMPPNGDGPPGEWT